MFPAPIERKGLPFRTVYVVCLVLSLVLWLLPMFAVMLTSIRSAGDITAGNYWNMPKQFNIIENYTTVLVDFPLGRYIFNSFKVTLPTMLGAVALSCMTGFALAVYRFKYSLLVFFIFIAGNFVPFQILMVPVRDLTLKLGMYDSTIGLVFFHVAFQTGFCTLFMRNFIKALPFELIEAARVEGVSEFKIFIYIVIPLVRPAIAALSVLVFTFIWNDYFWATVLVQGRHAIPVTAGLYSLNGEWIAAWHLVSAGSVIAAMPPVFLFFLLQRYFIAGLTLGAVK